MIVSAFDAASAPLPRWYPRSNPTHRRLRKAGAPNGFWIVGSTDCHLIEALFIPASTRFQRPPVDAAVRPMRRRTRRAVGQVLLFNLGRSRVAARAPGARTDRVHAQSPARLRERTVLLVVRQRVQPVGVFDAAPPPRRWWSSPAPDPAAAVDRASDANDRRAVRAVRDGARRSAPVMAVSPIDGRAFFHSQSLRIAWVSGTITGSRRDYAKAGRRAYLPARHQRPCHPGHLAGERQAVRLPRLAVATGRNQSASAARPHGGFDHRGRAGDEQDAQPFIAGLADAAHPLLPAGGMFPRRQLRPSGQMTTDPKRSWINLDRELRRRDRAHPRDRGQALADLVG